MNSRIGEKLSGKVLRQREVFIKAAMRDKFSGLLDWKKPLLEEGVGPCAHSLFDEFESKLANYQHDALEKLDTLSDIQLMYLVNKDDEAGIDQRAWWNECLKREIIQLRKLTPPPIAAGFCHPHFKPDYLYWSKMPRFNRHEAITLSVGCDPKHFSIEKMIELEKMMERKKLWPAYEFLVQRKELLTRYFELSGWGYAAMPVSFFKTLVDKIELEIPAEFYRLLDAKYPTELQNDPSVSEVPLSKLERQSLLKLIAAMACEQYAYNPADERSEAPSRIRDDVEQVGLNIDNKTIRKWLKEAANLVASDYWKKD